MKTPIEPSDIRKGDLIRWENDAREVAHEWRANADRDRFDGPPDLGFGAHYLLDRPKPAVELPTVPSLGWATRATADATLGTWQKYTTRFGDQTDYLIDSEREFQACEVTGFVAATAVPTDALDALRAYRDCLHTPGPTPAIRRIDTFLNAVDNAAQR